MTETDKSETKKDEQLFREYEFLINLWNVGMAEYHNLTNIYLTANSILLVAIAFIFGEYPIFKVPLLSAEATVNIYPEMLLCFLGIALCIQMAVAQSRLRSQNAYWERSLRIIEKKENWNATKFFNILYSFRENNITIPEDKQYFEKEFIPSFGIRYHRKCWLPRMKGLPKLYGLIYILLCIISLLQT